LATEYLSGKGLEFEEINIRQTPRAIEELQRMGVLATPALVIAERLIVGLDRDAIDRAVAALGPSAD
jgi:glutaredoxin